VSARATSISLLAPRTLQLFQPVMSRRPKRKRKKVDYNEQKLATAFDISNKRLSVNKKVTKTTAEKERNGKAPYKSVSKSHPRCKIMDVRASIPKRNKRGFLVFKDYPLFRVNLTPKQVLQAGSFGGTYFRPIQSGVTGEMYRGAHKEFPTDWFEGLNIKTQVTSATYCKEENKYGVKCGGDLDMWESSGWISNIDPYGWFQWFCRFYMGRRSTDDERQIKRGMGVMGLKGRFRNQLIGRCARGGRSFDDTTISPVIRQALQHWGYQLTQEDADAYVKLKGLPKLPRSK